MKEPYENQASSPQQAIEEPVKPINDKRTGKRPGRPRVVMPISAGRGVTQPWPRVKMEGSAVDRLYMLLEIARSRRVTGLLLPAVLALHFREKSDVYLRDLAEAIGTTTANITGVADQLEHLGLAIRKGSNADRRRITIALTPHGKSFIHWIEQLMEPGC